MGEAGAAQIEVWLAEGLRHYEAGEPARALEAWYRVLEVDPQNPRALDCVARVREGLSVDVPEPRLPPLSKRQEAAPARGGAPDGPLEERVSGAVSRSRDALYEDDPPPPPGPPPPATAPPEEEVDNQWELAPGATTPVDLDQRPSGPNIFDVLLAREREGGSGIAAVSPPQEAPRPTPAPAAAAPPKDATAVQNECQALMEGARELFALGDFSGSLELVEKVLAIDPENDEARAYLERNEATLLKMYESKIGRLDEKPRLVTSPNEVIWMNLHHRAGFLLSQVDGELTFEDLVAVSGMSRFETFRILAELVENGVISTS